jgi:carbon storage regulator
MLVLSRKKEERIIIGDGEIVITVVDIRGDKVRLGIDASPDIKINREEVYEAIKRDRLPTQDPRGIDGNHPLTQDAGAKAA